MPLCRPLSNRTQCRPQRCALRGDAGLRALCRAPAASAAVPEAAAPRRSVFAPVCAPAALDASGACGGVGGASSMQAAGTGTGHAAAAAAAAAAADEGRRRQQQQEQEQGVSRLPAGRAGLRMSVGSQIGPRARTRSPQDPPSGLLLATAGLAYACAVRDTCVGCGSDAVGLRETAYLTPARLLMRRSKCSPPSGCGVRSTSTTSSCRLPSTAPGPRGTLTSTTAPGKLPGVAPSDTTRGSSAVVLAIMVLEL